MTQNPTMKKLYAFSAILIGLLMVWSSGCRREPEGPVNAYKLTGTIVSLDAKARIAVIQHQDITDSAGKVWMRAMTMDFPVKSPDEFAKLKPGLKIRATVYQRSTDLEYWIGNIQTEGT